MVVVVVEVLGSGSRGDVKVVDAMMGEDQWEYCGWDKLCAGAESDSKDARPTTFWRPRELVTHNLR